MDFVGGDRFARVRAQDMSWAYCCTAPISGRSCGMGCPTVSGREFGGSTHKILASLFRSSRKSPDCTPKMTNEVVKAVTKA